jgi:hypothetical protein
MTYENFDRNTLTQIEYTTVATQAPVALPSADGFTVQLTSTGGTSYVMVSLDGVGYVKWSGGDVATGVTVVATIPVCRFVKVVTGVSTTKCNLTIWGY